MSAGCAARPEVAGEFHCTDFEVSEIEAEATERLDAQEEERRASLEAEPGAEGAGGEGGGAPAGEPWEDFYRMHTEGRFFKERRYLSLEFPELAAVAAAGGTVAEIGCGNGSTVLHLLRAGAGSVVAVDISPSAVRITAGAAERAAGPARAAAVRGHVCDVSDRGSEATRALLAAEGGACDAVVVVYVLSALADRARMVDMLR